MAWKRMTACAALLAVPAGAFAYLHPLLHLPIALALREESGQLVIGWNAAALMDGSRLEIRDGSERTIVMLPAHTASATYGPQGNDVEVRLTTDTRTGGAHWEAARFITRAVGRSSTAPAAGAVQGRIANLKREAQALRPEAGVETSLDTARTSACATGYTRTVKAFSARSTGR
jgi:hypothetical protein